MTGLVRRFLVLMAALTVLLCHAQAPSPQPKPDWAGLMAAGSRERVQGRIDLAIDRLQQALQMARGSTQQMQSAGELGAALMQARRLDQAEGPLRQARELAQGDARADQELALGNLARMWRERARARVGSGLGDGAGVRVARHDL